MVIKPKIVSKQGLSGLENIVEARGPDMITERKFVLTLNRVVSISYSCALERRHMSLHNVARLS